MHGCSSLLASPENCLEHTRHVLENFLVRKAQDHQAAPPQNSIAFGVIRPAPTMLWTIDLHHERCPVTIEIRYEAIYDLLTPEVVATKPVTA
jgi:hypothetical protein